jgi:hypothetical protein
MSDVKVPPEQPESPELSNFMRLARALFRVDKRDVPKHVVKKRSVTGSEVEQGHR